jgi:thiosulfate dehydrogenase [quinone] large subunit
MPSKRSLSLLRVAIGLLFLIFAEYKVFGTQFTLHGGFQYWINLFLQGGAYHFMRPVLRNFVLPRATVIAFLVAYGELAIAVSLITGIMVRAVSVCGLIYMLTLLFSSNYPGSGTPLWQYFGASLDHSVLALCFAAFALTDSDELWSMRKSMRRRRGKASSDASL